MEAPTCSRAGRENSNPVQSFRSNILSRWRAPLFDRRTILGAMLAAIPLASCSESAQASVLTIYKSPHCGCCGAWVEHAKASGFEVQVFETELVSDMADKLKVPEVVRSCHSAEIGGYFIEGHVPASDIQKLLRDRPKARGLAVPRMPVGSPGMEQGDQRDVFNTLLIERSGKATVFARHNQSSGGRS